jgi:hypothetical protein
MQSVVTAEYLYIGTLLACMENLKGGITITAGNFEFGVSVVLDGCIIAKKRNNKTVNEAQLIKQSSKHT